MLIFYSVVDIEEVREKVASEVEMATLAEPENEGHQEAHDLNQPQNSNSQAATWRIVSIRSQRFIWRMTKLEI